MKRDSATVVPMTQLAEFKYIMGFAKWRSELTIPNFLKGKRILLEGSCEMKNNTGEIAGIK
jgi:hypothetical protein